MPATSLTASILILVLLVASVVPPIAAFYSYAPRRASHLLHTTTLFARPDPDSPPQSPSESYGFDTPTPPPSLTPSSPEMTSQSKLRNSLSESAKFKIKNDARFTWLTFSLTAGLLSYGFAAAPEYVEMAGLPSNLGLAGAVPCGLLSIVCAALFVKPEGFR